MAHIPDLEKTKILGKGGLIEQNWKDIAENDESYPIVTEVKSCFAIVISQDCDCVRDDEISLFKITICSKLANKTSPKAIFEQILRIHHSNSLMYLPQDNKSNFPNKMQINFSSIISIKRKNLEKMKNFRLFRLNDESFDHFRNKVKDFILRYSFTESYPFTAEKFEQYAIMRKNQSPNEEIDQKDYQK